MPRPRASFVNQNNSSGFHPSNLHSFFEDPLIFESIDPKFSAHNKKAIDKDQEPGPRRKLLDRILLKVSISDLPGKQHAEHYFIYQYRKNCAANTIKSSYSAISHFLSFIKDTGTFHLCKVTRRDLEAFVEHEQDRCLKPATIKTHLCALYAFFSFLVERKIVNPDILSRKMNIKLPESLPRAIDPDDISSLLSVIDKPRDRAMILLLLRTGMRIGELLNTKVGDVNIKERKVLIYLGEKNSRGRVVYFSDDAAGAVLTWLKMRDSNKEVLFYGWGSNSLSYTAARSMFCKYLLKTGLLHKGYTLHCLRHTFASELLNAGMRLECLQQLLGHTSLEVTRIYARLTDKTREKEYFKAMSIIEKGEPHGHYLFNCEL
jgi:integrase/recombinase XerD